MGSSVTFTTAYYHLSCPNLLICSSELRATTKSQYPVYLTGRRNNRKEEEKETEEEGGKRGARNRGTIKRKKWNKRGKSGTGKSEGKVELLRGRLQNIAARTGSCI